MSEAITLADYIELEHASLDEFADWYAKNASHPREPEEWPRAMSPAEWWEQYIAWVQS